MMNNHPVAVLRKDLAATIRLGHPWVFDGAVSVPAGMAAGQAMDLHDGRGRFLARGLYDPASPIALRIWTRDASQPIDEALLRERLRQAAVLRRATVDRGASDAWRLVHGEADGLPALVADRYGTVAVLRCDSPAVHGLRAAFAAALMAQWPDLKAVVERQADNSLMAWEGRVPEAALVVEEHGLRLEADLRLGHKTGLYLDQRENRRRVGRLAAGRRVLNLYSYTGGFSVAAALGGAARVDSVDVAAPALAAAARNFALNGLPPESPDYGFHAVDAMQFLEANRGPWDLIVADPPSMAPSAEARPKALMAYRRLSRLCLERLAPGGILVSCSCSSHITAADLRGVLADAASQAGRPLRLFALHGAGPDHPVLPAFPEGDYLQAWYGLAT